MSERYRIYEQSGIHFLTLTITDWVDLFTRASLKEVVTDSLRYCQQRKGLRLHAWCLMPSHLHLIAAAEAPASLGEIIRDLKKHTNRELIHRIQTEPESRRDWLLYRFSHAAERTRRTTDYKVWQDGYHPIELFSEPIIRQKLDYLHQNPVKDGTVTAPEHYCYSSAANYVTGHGLLPVALLL